MFKLFYLRIQNHVSVSFEWLGMFRIFTGLFTLIFAMPTYGWIGSVPDSFFQPPVFSLSNLFNSFPPPVFFRIIDWAVLGALLLLTVGIKARAASLLYFIVNLIGLSFQFSFGKIDHSIFYFLLFPFMAIAGWGSYLALWPDKSPHPSLAHKLILVFALLLCFGMVTAGLPKALNWIDFDLSTSGFLAWYYNNSASLGRYFLTAPLVVHFPLWLTEVFDYSSVFIELSAFLFLCLSKRAWRLWLLMIAAFHLANTMFLNISFIIHLPVYLFFFDFPCNKKLFTSQAMQAIGIVTAILVILRAWRLVNNSVPISIFNPGNNIEVELWQGLILWTIFLMLCIHKMNKTSLSLQLIP